MSYLCLICSNLVLYAYFSALEGSIEILDDSIEILGEVTTAQPLGSNVGIELLYETNGQVIEVCCLVTFSEKSLQK